VKVLQFLPGDGRVGDRQLRRREARERIRYARSFNGVSVLSLVTTLGLALLVTGCARAAPAGSQPHPALEVPMSDQPPPLPSADRGAPPSVPALERDGVRYEQNLDASEAEFGQVGGVLRARDARTGVLLWSLKVYPNARQPGLEGDVQDIFFRSMAFDDENRLVIQNERGARFAIDVTKRTVTPVP